MNESNGQLWGLAARPGVTCGVHPCEPPLRHTTSRVGGRARGVVGRECERVGYMPEFRGRLKGG